MTSGGLISPAPQPAMLRTMTIADLDAILPLELALFGDESWSREMLADELSLQPGSRWYIVAEVDGEIAGYAGLMAAGDQADVLTIAVTAGRWSRGIGSQLLDGLLTEAVQRGCAEIFLEVRADNDRAHRLYLWWGFADIGIRRGYYQPSGMDAIVMRKALTGTLGWPAGGSAARDGAGSGRGEA